MAAISFSSCRSGWIGAILLLAMLWSLWALKPSSGVEVVIPTDLYQHNTPNKDTGRPYSDSPSTDGYEDISKGNIASPPLWNDLAPVKEPSEVISAPDGKAVAADLAGDSSWKTPVGSNEINEDDKHDTLHLDTPKVIATPSATRATPSVTSSQSIASAHSSGHAVAHASKIEVEEEDEEEDRPLVTYVYFETPIARENTLFFIKHGLHNNADFLFIINGDTDISQSIPDLPNVAIHAKDNDCYDLGSHAIALKEDDLWMKYKKFILMNASIRGPFFPVWAKECWTDMFLSRVTDTVKLVGMTANCWPSFHVQSMIWATDSIGLALLLQPTVLGRCFHDWQTAVNAEVDSTAVIQDAGYKVDTMMTAFHSDSKYIEHCDTSKNGDVFWEGGYFGSNIHPFETIFFKTNRDVDPILTTKLTEWTAGRNYSSYDACGA